MFLCAPRVSVDAGVDALDRSRTHLNFDMSVDARVDAGVNGINPDPWFPLLAFLLYF